MKNPLTLSIIALLLSLSLFAEGEATPADAKSGSALFPIPPLTNYEGVWLTNARAEAYVVAKPVPRVLAFRLKGETSPLYVDEGNFAASGIRTMLLEPFQIDRHSHVVSTHPATLTKEGSRTLLLEGEVDPRTKTQAIMRVHLDANAPVLVVTHGIKNCARETRPMAVWGIVSVWKGGFAVTPYSTGSVGEGYPVRKILFWPGTLPTTKGVYIGDYALGLEPGFPEDSPSQKVGTKNTEGYVAYLWDSFALSVASPYVHGARYPEGDGNVTIYRDSRYCELETVAPVRKVASQKTAWLTQRVTLVSNVADVAKDADAKYTAFTNAITREVTENGTRDVPGVVTEYAMLHFRADAGTVVDTTERVYSLTDKTTNGHNAVAPYAFRRPHYVSDVVNGKPGVVFRGEECLNLTATKALQLDTRYTNKHIFIAFKTGSDTWARQVIYKEGGAGRGLSLYINRWKLYIGVWNGGNKKDVPTWQAFARKGVKKDTVYIAELILDAKKGTLAGRLNGKEFAVVDDAYPLLRHGDQSLFGAHWRGATYHDGEHFSASEVAAFFFKGAFAEAVMFNIPLSDTEHAAVYDYLAEAYLPRD